MAPEAWIVQEPAWRYYSRNDPNETLELLAERIALALEVNDPAIGFQVIDTWLRVPQGSLLVFPRVPFTDSELAPDVELQHA